MTLLAGFAAVRWHEARRTAQRNEAVRDAAATIVDGIRMWSVDHADSFPDTRALGSSLAAASGLAAKYGLHLQSQVDSVRARVPRRLRSTKVWAIAESAAEDIGLSLRPSRGQTVIVTTYALAERVHKHPAFLCIAVRHGDVAAAWVRLGPGPELWSLEGPGVYSLKEVAQW